MFIVFGLLRRIHSATSMRVKVTAVNTTISTTVTTRPAPGASAGTLHLSAVTVDAEYRHLGVGTAMVDWALNDAVNAGFTFVETNWRVTNRRAGNYWRNYGFISTYVRLHRTIGTG